MLQKFWKRKSRAIRNWRSRAWSIDPKVTNLTIINSEESNTVIEQIEELFACPSGHILRLSEGLEACPRYHDVIADMEQFP